MAPPKNFFRTVTETLLVSAPSGLAPEGGTRGDDHMAIYHMHVQVISRGEGREATAAAAYRSGEKIKSEYSGLTHDYTRKEWVEHTEILLPENAPPEYKKREKLWQAVEAAETRRDARLSREVEVSLPLELSKKEQIELVKSFAQATFVADGMVADICIHNPPIKDGNNRPVDAEGYPTHDPSKMVFQNPHTHIMLTMRPIDPDGSWRTKTAMEYLCRKDGKERGFTAEEFKAFAEKEGWLKQYQFNDHGKKKWMTAEEGEKLHLERISRNPKRSKAGRPDPDIARWDSQETLVEWRKDWEEAINKALAKKGLETRVTASSYADIGSMQIPQVHMGPSAVAMSKKDFYAGAVERVNLNFMIKNLNDQNRVLRKEISRLENQKKKILRAIKEERTAVDREKLIETMVMTGYWIQEMEAKKATLQQEIESADQILNTCKGLVEVIDKENTVSEKRIAGLEKEEMGLGLLRIGRREEIRDEIQAEKKKIEIHREHLQRTLQSFGFASVSDLSKVEEKVQKMKKDLTVLESQIDACDKMIIESMDQIREKGTGVITKGKVDEDKIRKDIETRGGNPVSEHLLRAAMVDVSRRIIRQTPQRGHTGGLIMGLINGAMTAVEAVEAVEEQQEKQQTQGRSR